jgi:ATP-dependent helicase/nuclease subunit A
VVGDRKQSIYGFRGADVGVFAELAVGLAGAGAREALGIPAGVTWEPKTPLADFHALRHNRRSVPSILAFANAFSARRFRPGEPPPELFEIDYVPETEDLLVPPERDGMVASEPRTTWLRVQPKGSSSTRLEDGLVVAERIRALVAKGREHREIAVLAMTNGMLDAVAFALAQADIPYVVSGRSFFRTREVRDLAAFLAFVLDPSDRVAMLEVLRGPWAAVHDETLLALTAPGQGLVPPSRWNEPPNPSLLHDEDRAALTALAELVSSLSRIAGRLGPGAILREGLRARSLEAVLRAMPRGEQRVANSRKLLSIADRHADVRAFHRWLVDAMDQETSESEAATFSEADDAVRLLTIHASKGLDFPVVIIPGISAPAARMEKGAVRLVLGAGDAPNTLSVRIADSDGMVLEPPSFVAAWNDSRRRARAEGQRLAYVAVTRAAEEMSFVGGRASETTLDEGASTIAVLENLEGHPHLAVEDVEPPSAVIRAHDDRSAADDERAHGARPPIGRPAWRSLPIAPTALSDFAHCSRRFELVHLLGLPEHARRAGAGEARRASMAGPILDSRIQGTIAHAVLERLPARLIGAQGDLTPDISQVLATEGVAADHPQHSAIVARVARFVRSAYARTLAAERAELRREVDFVLGVDDDEGRTVTLRGSMDLVVVWPDGAVDVVDYKSARSGDVSTYAFQIDVYALAARASFPHAPRLRAGLVFLGGGNGEPIWRALPPEREVRARLAALGDRLVEARWTEAFPRVAIERCEMIHCGFIGRCHANDPGTEAKPSRATTT